MFSRGKKAYPQMSLSDLLTHLCSLISTNCPLTCALCQVTDLVFKL